MNALSFYAVSFYLREREKALFYIEACKRIVVFHIESTNICLHVRALFGTSCQTCGFYERTEPEGKYVTQNDYTFSLKEPFRDIPYKDILAKTFSTAIRDRRFW